MFLGSYSQKQEAHQPLKGHDASLKVHKPELSFLYHYDFIFIYLLFALVGQESALAALVAGSEDADLTVRELNVRLVC